MGDHRKKRRRPAGTFHESVRFPAPPSPVTLTIRKRGTSDAWQDVWTTTIDPKGMFVNTAAPAPCPGSVIALAEERRLRDKVDLLLLGDGYTAAERGKFETRRAAAAGFLFATSPFKERAARLQRLGARARRRGVWHLAAVARAFTALAGRRHLRRVRLRALRPDVRQQGVARRCAPSRRTTSWRS